MPVMDIGFIEGESSERTPIAIFKKQAKNTRAEIALEFINRWGMAAAETDGEDSAGRQKLKLSTPGKMVQRACQAADLLMSEFEKRGWLLDLPSPQPRERDLERV